jgi:ABC-type nitrate/sulfonate/bicarbonate transport system substrate-binding protein
VLIHTGLPERAEAKGMARFGTMLPDAVSSYTGVVATATRRWLDTHGDVAVRWLRAVKRGADYVLDPAHKAEIIAMLPADGNPATAEQIYAVLVDESKGGVVRDLRVDPKGLIATANLRQTWHGWEKPIDPSWIASPESGVYDTSYLERATLSR